MEAGFEPEQVQHIEELIPGEWFARFNWQRM